MSVDLRFILSYKKAMILVTVVSFYAEFRAVKFCSGFMCLMLFSVKEPFCWMRYTTSPNVQALHLGKKSSARGSTTIFSRVDPFFFFPRSQPMTRYRLNSDPDCDWILHGQGKDVSECRPAPHLPCCSLRKKGKDSLISLVLSFGIWWHFQ